MTLTKDEVLALWDAVIDGLETAQPGRSETELMRQARATIAALWAERDKLELALRQLVYYGLDSDDTQSHHDYCLCMDARVNARAALVQP